GLDLGYHEAAKIVDVFCLSADDHVVGPGHVLRLGDARDLADVNGDLSGFPDLGLNEDVRLHHAVLLGRAPGSGDRNATLRSPGMGLPDRALLPPALAGELRPGGDRRDHWRPG